MKKYMNYLLFVLFQLFFNVNSEDFIIPSYHNNYILSMFVEDVDDCIEFVGTTKKVCRLDVGTGERSCHSTIYPYLTQNCNNNFSNHTGLIMNKFYDFSEIRINILDRGDSGYLKIDVRLNEYLIKPELQKFWRCLNCKGANGNFIYNSVFKRFDFYDPAINGTQNNNQYFNFSFAVNSIDEIIGLGIEDKNYYTIRQTKDEYIYLNPFDEEQEIINFKNKSNFFITHNRSLNIQFDSVFIKIYYNISSLMTGEIYGNSFSNNRYEQLYDGDGINVNNENSTIIYKLSEKEKSFKAVHIKLYFSAYNLPVQRNYSTEVSSLSEFNYYICPDGYKACDVEISLKCLNEGYYIYNDSGIERYYSCYESCGRCDTYKNASLANIENHYCDECHSNYPLYINMSEYRNCYDECPLQYYKKVDSNECIKYGNYSSIYKYIYEKDKIIYNYIPNNYFAYIYDYDESNSPIINIDIDCPNDSYIKYISFCLSSINDIFLLISPLYFYRYENPIKIELKNKTLYIRTYRSDTSYDELVKKFPEYYNINISKCKQILKKEYNISTSLLIFDINDLQNKEYEFKIYSLKGNELNINFCLEQNASFCPSGYYEKNINNKNECIKCPQQCLSCSEESVKSNLCVECDNKKGFYTKINSDNNNNDNKEEKYVMCYNDANKLEDYYLNIEKLRYEPCYKTCQKCFGYGNENNNNCLNCINGYIIKEEYPYNCVEECPFYYYYDDFKHYNCTKDKECPNNKFILESKKKCVDNCYSYPPFIYIYQNECVEKCPLGTNPNKNNICIIEESCKLYEDCPKQYPFMILENKKCIEKCNPFDFFNKKCIIKNVNPTIINKMIDNIKNDILNGSLNSKPLSNLAFSSLMGNDRNIIFSISNLDEQENNNTNISVIKLNQCENILRDIYQIDKNDSLSIFKMDFFEEGLLIPIVEYEIYDVKNKRKLDLNYCNNTNIDIIFPVSINENSLFMYNISSEYYNDICFPYTTESKTDIILKDRREEFIKQNLSLCEKNCKYKGYDKINKRAKCNCKVKNKMNLYEEIINDKDKLLKNFVEIKSISNIEVIKCYKLLTNKDYIKYNIGFYLMLFIIFNYLVLLFCFILKGFNKLINQIKIILTINKTKDEKDKQIKIMTPKNQIDTNSKRNFDFNDKTKIISMNLLRTNGDFSIKSYSKIEFPKQKLIDLDNSTNINNKNNFKYNDYEINSLDYNDAIIADKRSYALYYFSLLKTKHLIIFTFYTKNDYNSRIIKFCLFLFFFSLYISVNALFFNDSTMHKIYIEKGRYNLVYQIPQIVYSTIISNVINSLIKYFSLTETEIIDLKQKKKKVKNFIKRFIIKFVIFFLLSFAFLFIFWFYLTCFCAVYYNTQIQLVIDTLISFGLSLLYPFGLYLIPGLFRIPALVIPNSLCLYKVSKYFQII